MIGGAAWWIIHRRRKNQAQYPGSDRNFLLSLMLGFIQVSATFSYQVGLAEFLQGLTIPILLAFVVMFTFLIGMVYSMILDEVIG